MENLGQRLKLAIEQSKLDKTQVASFMGISEGNLYKLFRKDSFELSYIYKASEVTGKPLSFFINGDSKIGEPTITNDTGNLRGDGYLTKYIAKLEKENEEKDQTIRFQQREIELLLGKYKVVLKGRFSPFFFTKRVQKRVQPISVRR